MRLRRRPPLGGGPATSGGRAQRPLVWLAPQPLERPASRPQGFGLGVWRTLPAICMMTTFFIAACARHHWAKRHFDHEFPLQPATSCGRHPHRLRRAGCARLRGASGGFRSARAACSVADRVRYASTAVRSMTPVSVAACARHHWAGSHSDHEFPLKPATPRGGPAHRLRRAGCARLRGKSGGVRLAHTACSVAAGMRRASSAVHSMTPVSIAACTRRHWAGSRFGHDFPF